MLLLLSFGLALLPQDTSNYWQQDVHYRIEASANDETGVITASENILYINNSPDTLDRIYFHLYLNAFRPGSKWADRDSVENNPRFNNLRDPDYAYDRIGRASINGAVVVPEYPYAPDSTIALLMLPQHLASGDSMVVDIDWQSRPSTLPRRQGRRGRRMDLAQWYPRVVVYDRFGWQDHPLYPMGEFYGEFGTYDVTFDLAEDQVIAATGIPIEGDPGWEGAKADPDLTIDYQHGYYSRNPYFPLSPTCDRRSAPNRKCVRFFAADVHHFAWSLNPDYIYEEGRFEDVVVRALYQPGDTPTWGGGKVVQRTETALAWFDDLFGDFPWPQITNIHRIEGGGTEFPMMMHNGSPSLGLILHEGGHNYLMGIFGNNEWKEGYLDEGFTSFQTTWFFEENSPGFDGYSGIENFILALDLDEWSQPVSFVSEDYRDFSTYSVMIYTKGQLFYHQLREIVGHDTMRQILRTYFDRWKLKHVTETELLEVAQEVSGMDLRSFFAQWLHGSPIYDYAIGRVERSELPDGRWRTTVEVRRDADGIFPVEVGEADRSGDSSVVYARIKGRAESETVSFTSQHRPGRLMIDPRVRSHDWNFTNNYEKSFGHGHDLNEWRLDDYINDPSRRDRSVVSVAPTLWYNDASGLTPGVRFRSNYGRFNRWEWWFQRGVGIEDEGVNTTEGDAFDFAFHLENPTFLRRPRTTQKFDFWSVEGTNGASVEFAKQLRDSWASRDVRSRGFRLAWVATGRTEFLDPALWENAGTVELEHFFHLRAPSGRTAWDLDLSLVGGVAYAREGTGTRLDTRHDTEGYGRLSAAGVMRRFVGTFQLGVRGYFGGYLAESNPLRQRSIQVAGANPYQTLRNPFVRTRGALLVRPDFFYHSPGEGNLRGFAPGIGGRWVAAVNVEFERSLRSRRRGVLRNLSFVAFTDGALVDTLAVASSSAEAVTALLDAGVGLRASFRVGSVNFPVRLEFPFYVNRPGFAVGADPGDDNLDFRWLLSFERSF